jgi:molecular chaperone DnaK (HSP70)
LQLTTNPENTVFDAKRLIGREWSDASVQHDIKYFPFKVLDKNSKPHIQVSTTQGDKVFAAEEISAMVLLKMKETAEAYLGKKVTHAVVTVPAVSAFKLLTENSMFLTFFPKLFYVFFIQLFILLRS